MCDPTASFAQEAPRASQPSSGSPPIVPSMALGLNGISYWGPNFPFIDLMKQASGGEMHPDHNAPPGSEVLLYDAMESRGLLDKDGWPKKIPQGYYWFSLVSADAGYVPSQKGRYVVRYKGNGRVSVVSNGQTTYEHGNEIGFEIHSDEIFIQIKIEETDPLSTGDYVRDIRVMKEEHVELYELGLLFNPKWLNLVQDMRVLRYMDWQFTNGSIERDWQQRSRLSTNTWGVTLERKTQKGVPIDVMVQLANITGTDPWFNIPYHADDNFVQEFARYVRDHLDPQLIAYFEYSNEVWNWIFQQTKSAHEQGEKIFSEYPLREYYGYRSAQISHQIHNIFGESAKKRVHMTLATQTDDNHYPLLLAIKGAEHYAKQHTLQVQDLFKSAAVTWYFGVPAELNKNVAQWIAQHGEDKAIDMIFEQFKGKQSHFSNVAPNDQPHIQKVLDYIRIQTELANKYQLATISYEGGTHFLGYEEYNESLAEFFIKVNHDPRMAELYEQVYQGWQKIPGARLLNHFVEVSNHTRWGSWGALQHLEDSSARWDFVIDANKRPGNFPPRPAQVFANGRIHQGDMPQEKISGTPQKDFLSGNGGNDIIKGFAGDDGLHGGLGNDKLFGGPGNDVLIGDLGDDEFHGGPGTDTFVFKSDSKGNNLILDFSSEDVIEIRRASQSVLSKQQITDALTLKSDKNDTKVFFDQDGKNGPAQPEILFTLKGKQITQKQQLNIRVQ